MKLSARNQLKGKIVDVKKGATTSHVRLEIAPGQIITSSITNEAVDELGLKAGGTGAQATRQLQDHLVGGRLDRRRAIGPNGEVHRLQRRTGLRRHPQERKIRSRRGAVHRRALKREGGLA
jgi:molybdopterin-binding protein